MRPPCFRAHRPDTRFKLTQRHPAAAVLRGVVSSACRPFPYFVCPSVIDHPLPSDCSGPSRRVVGLNQPERLGGSRRRNTSRRHCSSRSSAALSRATRSSSSSWRAWSDILARLLEPLQREPDIGHAKPVEQAREQLLIDRVAAPRLHVPDRILQIPHQRPVMAKLRLESSGGRGRSRRRAWRSGCPARTPGRWSSAFHSLST